MFDYLFLPKEEQSVVQRTGPSPYFQGHDRRPFYFWDDFYPLVDKKGKNHSVTCEWARGYGQSGERGKMV